ncbi:MAG: hypothetical protein AB1679_01395 [Actinomycetota bacterium]|jgi:hypothetical protein
MTELLDSMIELLTSVPIGSPERPAGAATTRRCLRCWSEDLRPVESAGGTNLFCTGCHRCWRFEDGYLVEVNPYACSGCANRSLCRQR